MRFEVPIHAMHTSYGYFSEALTTERGWCAMSQSIWVRTASWRVGIGVDPIYRGDIIYNNCIYNNMFIFSMTCDV